MENNIEEKTIGLNGVDRNIPICYQNKDKVSGSMQISSNESDSDSCFTNIKKRITNFSDSAEDSNKTNAKLIVINKNGDKTASILSNKSSSCDDESDDTNMSHIKRKSRIRDMSLSDEDIDDTTTNEEKLKSSSQVIKNVEQQCRMKMKTNKLKNRFKCLTKSRRKHIIKSDTENSCNDAPIHNRDDKSRNNSSEDELSSIELIKQKIKERNAILKSTIYDPDTSDDDDKSKQQVQKIKRKSMKMTSPKPMKMSAKQAMDNMQKIKSESNRMLREKEVSLPYHKPKALALKDILNRRKPAVSSDGKALPLKMNDEQLKLYAQLLEQRQKEMLELCKSDTEDDETFENETAHNDNVKQITDSEILDNKRKINDCATDVNTTLKPQENIKLCNENGLSKDTHGKKIDENSTIGNDIGSDTCNIGPDGQDVKLNEQESFENDISYDNLLEANNTVTEDKKNENLPNTEPESQLISLHYDSEKVNNTKQEQNSSNDLESNMEIEKEMTLEEVENKKESMVSNENNDLDAEMNTFSDNDIDMEDIDRIIENADIIESQGMDSPMLIKDAQNLKTKPQLTGAPGMVIDLDGNNASQTKKVSGVELLKQRFTYFNQLKTAKEIQQATQQKIKPGTQHLKLKQELEEQMAEQRSLEWAKRLEEEKLQRQEMNALRGDGSDEEDDIDRIEAKLAGIDNNKVQDDVSTESEPEEDDIVLEDKKKKNSEFVADEAEESDCDDFDNDQEQHIVDDEQNDASNESNDESSDEESTDADGEVSVDEFEKQRKGRILRAFEDSDEERDLTDTVNNDVDGIIESNINEVTDIVPVNIDNQNSQDEELPSAQLQKSFSEDLFTSQDSDLKSTNITVKATGCDNLKVNKLCNSKAANVEKKIDANLAVISETQAYDDAKFDDIAGMCSGSFSQNVISTQSQTVAQTQDIGDDVLALCTGKFYDNEFISQQSTNLSPELSNEAKTHENESKQKSMDNIENKEKKIDDGNLLKSILLELDDPEFEDPKPYRYFDHSTNKEDSGINQQKKRLVIESDDEAEKPKEEDTKRKRRKKKKLQDRALQISDDEEDEEVSEEENVDDMSDLVDDTERLVEYDSEENEVVIQQPQSKKVKRKMAEFFEQEAELTSEDEWVGSGDEDEAGLDRMEREAGDDDQFHQGKLQRELGQIHMRDVLDQDKREVRLIQELLFEDGDLGDGHRQRKFRWKNADGGDVESGAGDDLTNTQEDEFESEEQWRKQRHERETFLREMQKDGVENETLNISVNRTAIIKANLSSRTMSSLLMEVNSPKGNKPDNSIEKEKKPGNDIPSPTKKAFPTLQYNYRGSLLSRGSGALARLAAIATPLAGDVNEKAPKLGALKSGKGNFVFAAVSPKPDEPKVSKRKKNSNEGTPQLMKKLKTDEKRDLTKKSLLDHLSV